MDFTVLLRHNTPPVKFLCILVAVTNQDSATLLPLKNSISQSGVVTAEFFNIFIVMLTCLVHYFNDLQGVFNDLQGVLFVPDWYTTL